MPAPHPPVRGDIAQALRLAHGHILRDVHSATGIHVTTLSQIEHGRRDGRPHLPALAQFLGAPVDVLAGHRPALAVLREAAGVPADVLAAAAGISPDELADIEEGREVPDALLARRLADLLVVKPSTLTWTPPDGVAA